jgi:hypothetical protein
MTPFIEGFLIAFLAGITVGWANRKILKFKKMRSRRLRGTGREDIPSDQPAFVSVDVEVED